MTHLHQIYRQATVALAAMAMLAACSNDIPVVSSEDSSGEETTTTAGRLRINLDPTATRGLTYNGASTTMEKNTLVGCIITYGSTASSADYYGTAAWTYDKNDNCLIIKRWWTYDDNAWTLHNASSESSDDDLSYDEDGYTIINTDKYLYFYFYYPYIDPINFADSCEYIPHISAETTTNSGLRTRADDDATASSITYLTGMAVDDSITTTAISSYTTASTAAENSGLKTRADDATNLSTAVPIFSWKKFPVFINTDQSKKQSINMSDFLYDAYEVGVNKNSTGTLNVQLRKETATLRVTSEIEIENLRIVQDSLIRGYYFNLYSDSVYSEFPDSCFTDTIFAYTNEEYSDYQFIIPAQNNWSARLLYNLKDDSKNKTYSTSLSSFGSISNGKLYTVDIVSVEDSYCTFSSTGFNTWVNTDYFKWGYDKVEGDSTGLGYGYETGLATGSSPSTFGKMSSSVTVADSTITAYMKLEGGPKTYLKIILPATMYVTVYTETTYPSDSLIYIYDSGGSSLVDSIKLTHSGSGGNYIYNSVQLSKGKYKIMMAKKQPRIYMVSLTKKDPIDTESTSSNAVAARRREKVPFVSR